MKTLYDYYLKYKTTYDSLDFRKLEINLNEINELLHKYGSKFCCSTNVLFHILSINRNNIISLKSNFSLKSELTEVITNGRCIVGRRTLFENFSSDYISHKIDDYLSIEGSLAITELTSPVGSLISCIIVDILENYFQKSILQFTYEDFLQCKGQLTKLDFPKFISDRLFPIIDNSKIFVYYRSNNFNSPWNFYTVENIINSLSGATINLVIRSKDKIEKRITIDNNTNLVFPSNFYWRVALSEEMLSNQLKSIKRGRLHYIRHRIFELESNLIKLNEKKQVIEKDRDYFNFINDKKHLNSILDYYNKNKDIL